RSALSRLLGRLADAVQAYGGLVTAEVTGDALDDAALRDALEQAWNDYGEVVELLRQGERLAGAEWALHGNVAITLERLLREIDSESRAEMRKTWPSRVRAGRGRRPDFAVRAARSRIRSAAARAD